MKHQAYYITITDHSPRMFELDDGTALWAARMCVGEGGMFCSRDKCAAMLWALANRFLLHKSRWKWKHFRYMMRRFSQPINPRWLPGGDLYAKNKNKKSCSPARIRRRRRICKLQWWQIPPQIKSAVRAFQRGELAPPTYQQIINWASYPGLKEKYPNGRAYDNAKHPDWFFAEPDKTIKGRVVIDHGWFSLEGE